MKTIVKDISIFRGHMVIQLSDERFIHVEGELTLTPAFYSYKKQQWFYIKKPDWNYQFLNRSMVLGTVDEQDKDDIIAAIDQYNSEADRCPIIFD